MKPPPDIKPSIWVEVRLSAPAPQAAAAADFLTALSGRGVQLSPHEQQPEFEVVVAYLTEGPDLAGQKAQVQAHAAQLAALCGPGEMELTFAELPQEDWSANWKQHFHPRLVSRRLIVAPPWEPGEPQGDQEMVVIDPGQAFGTGQHQSTQLVLRCMEQAAEKGRLPGRVLDVGCGSGILSLAALKFGATSALAIDIDPLAVEASEHNARLNGLAQGLVASLTPLEEVEEIFPLVLANITAQDLIELSTPLRQRLAKGGELVVSGLLVTQIDKVRAAYEALGLNVLETDSLAGWAALVLT
jgi:ribosomal protein L11 methyltransferase